MVDEIDLNINPKLMALRSTALPIACLEKGLKKKLIKIASEKDPKNVLKAVKGLGEFRNSKGEQGLGKLGGATKALAQIRVSHGRKAFCEVIDNY